ncbi:MAG: hypothetical protein HYX69_07655 [Planctomycetia bacterium]|nr:hypothetical protein [Planctomycetia bacterium]
MTKPRELTHHRRCFQPITEMIGELNVVLQGWKAYFRHGYPRMAPRAPRTREGSGSPRRRQVIRISDFVLH